MTLKITYLGSDDLAELFGVTRRTVGNWVKRELIPPPTVVNGRNRHPLQETLQSALDAGLPMSESTRQLVMENLSPMSTSTKTRAATKKAPAKKDAEVVSNAYDAALGVFRRYPRVDLNHLTPRAPPDAPVIAMIYTAKALDKNPPNDVKGVKYRLLEYVPEDSFLVRVIERVLK